MKDEKDDIGLVTPVLVGDTHGYTNAEISYRREGNVVTLGVLKLTPRQYKAIVKGFPVPDEREAWRMYG